MRKSITLCVLLLIGSFWISTAMAIEEPRYDVVTTEGEFEIRRYAPILVA